MKLNEDKIKKQLLARKLEIESISDQVERWWRRLLGDKPIVSENL